jgi:CO/xanthine dehydrogenase FAD-binding subunit
VKAFAYVNPTNEKDAIAALSQQIEQAMPIGGGQDLLARMKDYVTQPDRIVNVKVALESTVTPLNGGLRIGAAMRMVDVAEHAEIARMYPALSAAANEVGTPQIRNQATVGGNLNQRPRCWYYRNEEFVCFKKGGNTVLFASGREPVPRNPWRRAELYRASVESRSSEFGLRRDVPAPPVRKASAWCRRQTTSRCPGRACEWRTCLRRMNC